MAVSSGTRFATVLILVTVFVSGGLLGAALDRRLGAEPAPVNETPENQRGERRERGMIVDEVNPSPEQKAQIDSIVALNRDRIRDLRDRLEDEYRPLRRDLVLETREAIKSVLSPEQAAEYTRLLAEYDEKRRNRDSDSNGSR
jgi:Spy/CpxP family protein refolding chaperone